ncbi:hypothetical protein TSUD_156810 [Trifolium subterraneum]|uniref:Uncharacterized protein n=1 Tax=Trifolium subterraneum TaxID=3900 RepID=A0A2Z6M7T3_TRISU|nr:hypothetical protein TSUD_156810 [Trifolium subterraneum]
MVDLRASIDEHSCWSIGHGRNVHAWTNCWIAPGLCITNLDVVILAAMINVTVAELVDAAGSWNWLILQD